MSREMKAGLPAALALAGTLTSGAANAQSFEIGNDHIFTFDNSAVPLFDGLITVPSSIIVGDDIVPYVPGIFGLEIDHDTRSTNHFSLGWTSTPRNNSGNGAYFTDGFALTYAQGSGDARLTVGRDDLDITGYVRDYVIRELSPLYDRHLSDYPDIVSRSDFNRTVRNIGTQIGEYITENPDIAYINARALELPNDGIPDIARPHLQEALDSLQDDNNLMRDIDRFQGGLRDIDSYSNLSRTFESYSLGAYYTGEIGYALGANSFTRGTDLFVDWRLGLGGTLYETNQQEYFGCGGIQGSVGIGARHHVSDQFSATASIRGNLPIEQKCVGGARYTPDINPTLFIGAELKF